MKAASSVLKNAYVVRCADCCCCAGGARSHEASPTVAALAPAAFKNERREGFSMEACGRNDTADLLQEERRVARRPIACVRHGIASPALSVVEGSAPSSQ